MQLKLVLEAILFCAQKPLSAKELRELLLAAAEQEPDNESVRACREVTEAEIVTVLEDLAREHDAAQRSYKLACIAGAWQFVTHPEYAPWIKALVGVKPRPPRLSMPALETLAIIAYRQPITRAEVEQIRGVNVDGVIQTLLERGLIAPVGRADVVGRPVLYGTTELFLEYFGLRSLDDLPAVDELRRPSVPKPADAGSAPAGLATAPPEQLAQPDEAHQADVQAPARSQSESAAPAAPEPQA